MNPIRNKSEAKGFIVKRHPEWVEHQRRWRFLADSYEGGNRYRHADYEDDPIRGVPGGVGYGDSLGMGDYNGQDMTNGQMANLQYNRVVDRNLIPHRSEMSPEGQNLYTLRMAQTPVPKTLERAIRRGLSRIYGHEVQRDGPADVVAWWADVDGLGTPIDKWMRKIVAPLIMTYGQLDLACGRPSLRPGQDEPMTRADVASMGLDRCVATYILPENLPWYRLDGRRRYLECLVVERDDGGKPLYRHWDESGWSLYDGDGELLGFDDHPFGRVPILRIFDERKPRCLNVGQPRYESVAENQRALYNSDSNLVLQDVFQSGATLAVPRPQLTAEGEFKVGPSGILAMEPTPDNSSYQAPVWLARPSGSSADLMAHMEAYRDTADRDSALAKPAGANSRGTVAQSGISKAFDSQETNDYLSEVSETLADAERSLAELVMDVLRDGESTRADMDAVVIVYPKEFDLFSAEDLADALATIQSLAAAAGTITLVEKEAIKRIVRNLLPGLGDDKLGEMDRQIDEFVDGKAEGRAMAREAGLTGLGAMAEDDDPTGSIIADSASALQPS